MDTRSPAEPTAARIATLLTDGLSGVVGAGALGRESAADSPDSP